MKVTNIHDAYWLGVAFGLLFGTILGWMLASHPVRKRRQEARDTAEIQRILSFEQAPLRTMDEIAADPQPEVLPAGPRHLRVEETEWSQFRDSPRDWLKLHTPHPRTPLQVAEETYQETVWKRTGRHTTPVVARLTTSFSGAPASLPAPWLGSTAVIEKRSTGVSSTRISSTLAPSGKRSNTATSPAMT